MFTGPVGPVEDFFYWPEAVFENFYWPGAIGSPLASSPGPPDTLLARILVLMVIYSQGLTDSLHGIAANTNIHTFYSKQW